MGFEPKRTTQQTRRIGQNAFQRLHDHGITLSDTTRTGLQIAIDLLWRLYVLARSTNNEALTFSNGSV